MAKMNPFRFSTQYQDDETDLLMYVHRPFSASHGRFLSRDPMLEHSFEVRKKRTHPELKRSDSHRSFLDYVFVENKPTAATDYLGLVTMHAELCTVTIFYGHGAENEAWKWDSAGPCSAGGFIGCYSGNSNEGIPANNQVPGFPSTDESMTAREMTAAVNAAWSAAYTHIGRALCRKCRCVCPAWTIKVILLKTGLGDWNVGDEHHAHPDFVRNCP